MEVLNSKQNIEEIQKNILTYTSGSRILINYGNLWEIFNLRSRSILPKTYYDLHCVQYYLADNIFVGKSDYQTIFWSIILVFILGDQSLTSTVVSSTL